MKICDIVFIRDLRKKKFKTHTIDSASIFSESNYAYELTDIQLDDVIGGMSNERFNVWKVKKINDTN